MFIYRPVGQVFSRIDDVLVFSKSVVVPVDFLVVHSFPLDSIIDSPTLESLQTNINYGNQQTTLILGKNKTRLPLPGKPCMI